MGVVKYSVMNRVAYIEISRPEKRNALNDEVVNELKKALSTAQTDADVKAIVLSGSGTTFCSGADLGYLQGLQNFSQEENLKDSSNLMQLFSQIYSLPKPVIAKVNGAAIAGGCGLVSVCDFAFSTLEAKFGYTEVRIGFIPAIVMVFLVRKIGESKAKRFLLSGEIFDAETAEKAGLINGYFEEEELDTYVSEFAENICSQNSGTAMAMTKEMIKTVQDLPIAEALNHAVKMNAKARTTEDCKKGISSFLNKEKLEW